MLVPRSKLSGIELCLDLRSVSTHIQAGLSFGARKTDSQSDITLNLSDMKRGLETEDQYLGYKYLTGLEKKKRIGGKWGSNQVGGAFGDVYSGRYSETHAKVALKEIDKARCG